MEVESQEPKMTTFELFTQVSGVVMTLVYVGVGIALLWKPTGFFNLSLRSSQWLGGLLIVYGLFRGYKVYQRFQNS